MSTPLLVLVTIIYLYVACEFFYRNATEMGIVYLGYAAANIGLVMLAMKEVLK